MKQCKRCGRKLPNDALICAYCGLKLTTQKTAAPKKSTAKKTSSQTTSKRNSYDSYRKKKMQQEAVKKRRRRRLRIFIFWLALITILGAVFGGLYANKNYKSVINPTSEETTGEIAEQPDNPENNSNEDASAEKPTAEPEKTQEPTPQPTTKSETLEDKVLNGGCVVYEDASYEFKCAYPEEFVEGTLKNNNTRASFADADGGAEMLINFEKISKSETPKKLLDDYLEIIGVDPDIKNSGDKFYSVTFSRGGRIYHRKAIVANEKYIYYDFMYDQGSDSKSQFEVYIDTMDMYLEQANKSLLK